MMVVEVLPELNYFFFSSRSRHTICGRDWSSDVCSSDLVPLVPVSDMPTVTLPVTVAPSAGLVEPLHNAGDGQVGLRRRRRTAQISPARRADGAPVLPRELTAQE